MIKKSEYVSRYIFQEWGVTRRLVIQLCRTFPVFPYLYQDVAIVRFLWWMKWVYLVTYSVLIVNEMSLSDDLLRQTHWRRFEMRLCRAFLVFAHSYQSLVTDLRSERISWGTLLSKYTLCIVCTHFFNPQQNFRSHLWNENLEITLHYLK